MENIQPLSATFESLNNYFEGCSLTLELCEQFAKKLSEMKLLNSRVRIHYYDSFITSNKKAVALIKKAYEELEEELYP